MYKQFVNYNYNSVQDVKNQGKIIEYFKKVLIDDLLEKCYLKNEKLKKTIDTVEYSCYYNFNNMILNIDSIKYTLFDNTPLKDPAYIKYLITPFYKSYF